MRNSVFLFLFFCAFIAGCSGSGTTKNGTPDEKEAKDIVKKWFDDQKNSPGGRYFEQQNFDIVSVTGDAKLTIINFKWTGLAYPAPLPGSNNSPFKVTDKAEKMQAQNNNGKWEVLVVEDQN